jgi:5-methylcytosine-specific restriction enzyme A
MMSIRFFAAAGRRHGPQPQRQQTRPTARERGYDSKWERETKAFLVLPENRFCACGCGQRANVVDHGIAHKGDKRLFWDRRNWRPFNRSCNSRKAAAREGGFGNPLRSGPDYSPAVGGDGVPLDRAHPFNRGE